MAQEPVKLIVVTIEDEEKSLKIGLCPEDYSKLYSLTLYKEDYNKATKEWTKKEEVTKRYEEELEKIGGMPKVNDKIEVYTSDNGKAYLEPSTFIQTVKPDKKMIGKLLMNCVVERISDSPKGRRVIVAYKGKHYEFSFNTSVWVPSIKKFVPNDAKLENARERFNDIFEESTITWDNTLIESEGEQLAKGVKLNCIVRKNELDGGQTAYLEPVKIEEDEEENPF